MSEVHLVKTIGGWKGADPQSDDICRAFGVGEIVRADLRKPRNARHHRKAMSLLNLVYDNCPDGMYPSFDALLTDIKLKCGHYEQHVNYRRDKNGDAWVQQVIQLPKSISFSAMGQEQFADFYDRMFSVVLDQYLPGIGRAELEQAVLDYESRWGA